MWARFEVIFLLKTSFFLPQVPRASSRLKDCTIWALIGLQIFETARIRLQKNTNLSARFSCNMLGKRRTNRILA